MCRSGGEDIDTRSSSKDSYSAIEERKADVLDLEHPLRAGAQAADAFSEVQPSPPTLGLHFRSMRFGIDEAHRRGTAVQWNWLREKGAIVAAADGTFPVDNVKMRQASGPSPQKRSPSRPPATTPAPSVC